MYKTTCDRCKKVVGDEYVYLRYTNKSDWSLGKEGHFCNKCGKSLIAFVKKQKWPEPKKSAFQKESEKRTGKPLLSKTKK